MSEAPKPETESQPIWMKRVPMVTGALAAMAGFLTVRSTTISDLAILEGNNATFWQAKASDTWNEYQADSVKARVVETAILTCNLTDEKMATLKAQAEELRKRQPDEKVEAKGYEVKVKDAVAARKHRLDEKDMTDYAGVAAQLGIALASVAALTRRVAAFHVGVAIGAAAVALTVYAVIMHYLPYHG